MRRCGLGWWFGGRRVMKEIMMEFGKIWYRFECGGLGRWMEDLGGLEDLEIGVEGCVDFRVKMGSV